jgi:uncharacterized protein
LLKFEWDDDKAAENERKHGVTFEEAKTVCSDPNSISWYDAAHSRVEDRMITLGTSSKLRVLFVVWTLRQSDTARIISARKATKTEQKAYGHAKK